MYLRLLTAIAVALVTVGVAAGGGVAISAAPGATITVNSTGDIDDRDGVLTLREAMLLARGDGGVFPVGDLDSGECGQVSSSTYGPPCSTTDTIGTSSDDTIRFDTAVFPPGGTATITLGSSLPMLWGGVATP